MREYELRTGEVVTEAELLRRAANRVDHGEEPVAAAGAIWFGNGRAGRPLIAQQLIRACTPWLEHLIADHAQTAAAMRARAGFLEDRTRLCHCGHPFDVHDASPCLPHSGKNPCRTCRWSTAADPVGEDADCE